MVSLTYTPTYGIIRQMHKSIHSVGATPGPFPLPPTDPHEAKLDALIETTVPVGRRKKALVPIVKKGVGRPSLIKKRLPTIIALAGQGWSHRQISEFLTEKEGVAVTHDAVRQALYRIRKTGQLVDTEERLAYMAAPMAVDVVVDALERGDIETAKETLKGLGYFKAHQAVKQEGGATKLELEVKFSRPEGSVEVIEGSVVGEPINITPEVNQ